MGRKASLRKWTQRQEGAKGTCGAQPSTQGDSKYKDPEAGDIWLDQKSIKGQRAKGSAIWNGCGRWGGTKQWGDLGFEKFTSFKKLFHKLVAGKIMAPQCLSSPPALWICNLMWQRGIKVANQLTLKKGVTLHYSGEPNVITEVLKRRSQR